MFRETAKKIASRDPGLAASWLESNLGNKSVNGEVVGQVASSWVEKDPAAAANWVSSLKGTRVYDKELTKKLGAHGQERIRGPHWSGLKRSTRSFGMPPRRAS